MLNNSQFIELLNQHYATTDTYPHHLTQGYITIKVPIRFRLTPLLPPGSTDADRKAALYAVALGFVAQTEWELGNIIGDELDHVVSTAYHSGEFDVATYNSHDGAELLFEVESSHADDPYEVASIAFDVENK